MQGWVGGLSRFPANCIPDVAALFRWPGVSPDPGPSPATGEKPGWAAATYNLPFPLEAPVNPGPVTPPSLPPLQGFLHIRVSNSVLYLLGGPGADSTLTTTLTPTELGPTQANPGTPHQGVHPRHAPATYSDSSSARGPPGARRVKGLVGARWLRVWNPHGRCVQCLCIDPCGDSYTSDSYSHCYNNCNNNCDTNCSTVTTTVAITATTSVTTTVLHELLQRLLQQLLQQLLQ